MWCPSRCRLCAGGAKMFRCWLRTSWIGSARQRGFPRKPLEAVGFLPHLQALTDPVLLQRHSPAAVLPTANGDVVYFSGKTGKYLEPPAGKANLNVFAMAREGLSVALNEAF